MSFVKLQLCDGEFRLFSSPSRMWIKADVGGYTFKSDDLPQHAYPRWQVERFEAWVE